MRTIRERIVHTALFEIIAVATVTPSISWLTGASMTDSGVFSLLSAAGAMLANYVWTLFFDRLVPTRRRGFWLRAAQAVGLEVIISSFTIPLVIILTGVSFWKGVAIDVTGIAFFILFGMTYNLAFDAAVMRLTRQVA